MAKLSSKPEWTDDVPSGASIVALISGSIYRLDPARFTGPQGEAGPQGATGPQGVAESSTIAFNPSVFGSTVFNTTQTLADLGPFTVDMEANRIYNIEFKMHFTCANGLQVSSVYDGTIYGTYLDGHWTAGSSSPGSFHLHDTASTAQLIDTASAVTYLEGLVTVITNTAGNWKFQFANNNSSGAAVLWGGSFIRVYDAGVAL